MPWCIVFFCLIFIKTLDIDKKLKYCFFIQYLSLNHTGVDMHTINKTNNVIPFSQTKNFTEELTKVCLQHQKYKKWILVINNEQDAFTELSTKQEIDQSKILHINSGKINIKASNIKTALQKGNCSAVVLANSHFESEQMTQLTACAKQSNTEFVVYDKVSGLH